MRASVFLLLLALLVAIPSTVIYAVVMWVSPMWATPVGVLSFLFIFSQIIDWLTTR